MHWLQRDSLDARQGCSGHSSLSVTPEYEVGSHRHEQGGHTLSPLCPPVWRTLSSEGASPATGLVSPFPEPVVAPSSVPSALCSCALCRTSNSTSCPDCPAGPGFAPLPGGTAALGDSPSVRDRKGLQWCEEGQGTLPSREAPTWLPLLVFCSQAVTGCQHMVTCLAAVGARALYQLPLGAAPQLPPLQPQGNLEFPVPQEPDHSAPRLSWSAGMRRALF